MMQQCQNQKDDTAAPKQRQCYELHQSPPVTGRCTQSAQTLQDRYQHTVVGVEAAMDGVLWS
eukprot:6244090-Ditylum_brightwellii.AAC.1